MSSDSPDWWQKNDALRAEMGLPQYVPSRFTDGTYVHEAVAKLERTHDCDIRLSSHSPRYPSEWAVIVDGTVCLTVVRRRDANANNIYQISADEFRRRIRELVDD